MNVRPLIAAAMMFGSMAAQATLYVPATTTNDYGSYSVTFDNSSPFFGPSSSYTSGGGQVGFSWDIPTSIGIAGTNTSFTFYLPDFTVTANSGYSLSGPLTGFIGNMIFNEFGGATTAASISGSVSIDSPNSAPFGAGLARTVGLTLPGFASGYYSLQSTQSYGTFSSLTVSGLALTLSTANGGFGSVLSQPQNKIEFSFIANPVPEPESYAMMLVGLLAVGTIVLRRQKA